MCNDQVDGKLVCMQKAIDSTMLLELKKKKKKEARDEFDALELREVRWVDKSPLSILNTSLSCTAKCPRKGSDQRRGRINSRWERDRLSLYRGWIMV